MDNVKNKKIVLVYFNNRITICVDNLSQNFTTITKYKYECWLYGIITTLDYRRYSKNRKAWNNRSITKWEKEKKINF